MTLQTTGLSLLLIGLILLWLALRRIRFRRPLSGMVVSLVSLASLALGALAIGLSVSFHVLDQFTHEQDVGSISLREVGPRVYEATLQLADETRPRLFRLAGDQWHLHVRFLKWQYPATLMGIRSLYQLEQLRGRYEDPQALDHVELTAYHLSKSPGLALWRLAKSTQRWLPWIDAVYGNSVYLPMADGASYRISVTTSGLIARPENEQARKAVLDW
jgi:hypothetical protein